MRPGCDHVARRDLRIGEHLAQVVDGAARHLGRLQRGQPVGLAARLHHHLELRYQLRAVQHAVAVLGKQGIAGEFRHAGHGAKLGVLRVIADRQDQVVFVARFIGCDFKHLVGHDVLVGVADAARHLAADQVVGAQVGQHGHLGVEQCHVDLLAFAGFLGMTQRRQNTHRGVHAGHQVGHGHADFLRPTAQVVALAGDAHQSAHALNGVVVTGTVGIRPGLTETGDRAVNDARIDGLERGVVQAVARHVADLEVLDKHIAVQRQFANQGLAGRLRNVTGHRALVAVGAQVVGGFARFCAAAVVQKGRAPAARVVTSAGALDLDDIGAQVGQGLGAPRAGEYAGEVENADALERVHPCILPSGRRPPAGMPVKSKLIFPTYRALARLARWA